MIDMHTHVLPCLDDGAEDVEQSIDIIKQSIAQGVTDIIATPHYNKGKLVTTKQDVEKSYNVIKKEIEANRLQINIFLGHEVNLHEDINKLLNKSEFFTLSGSRYVLLEIEDNDLSKEVIESLYEFKVRGYIPIIAHFERCVSAYSNLKLLRSILDEEVLLQINSNSILSKKESNIETKFAKFLLDNKLVSFIASDCHNASTRSPNLLECFKYIKRKYGLKYAEELFMINPKKIIDNIDIQYLKYEKDVKKLDIFKFFK